MWLKSRLAGLSEVSSDLEVQRQRTALAKLSTDLRALFSSLCQVFKAIPNAENVSLSCVFSTQTINLSVRLPHSQWGEEGSAMFQYEELGEEVRGALEEVLTARREAEEQTSRILDAEGLEEAKHLYLIHQVCIVQRQESGDVKLFATVHIFGCVLL